MIRSGAKRMLGAGILAVATLQFPGGALAERYKVTSLAPGLTPFVVNTTIARVVNTHVDGIELQVSATGTATRHMMDAATGRVDFLFGAPTINWMMVNRLGPFQHFETAPALEQNVGMIFAYQMGPYHYITRAGSGIESLADLRSRTVFAGPPGGAATEVVLRVIEQSTGITPGEMKLQAFGFDAAIQAFQDGKIDVIVLPTNLPSAAVQQFALTSRIRLLDVDLRNVTIRAETGGTANEIPPDAYGPNQVNDTATRTHGSIVNFSAGMHVPEHVVYEVTRAIWENLGDIHSAADWMPGTITPEMALSLVSGRLHPGAERYYREAGWPIPEAITFPPPG
ncbi:TAXI family TRAP transporter solute-binding subunit [Dinoroseobacter shibae]|nr:TAXI family TRAP transporter solute-binding subunit [Dinoroseobacter shibae]URF45466.1 TAXI family TRAP transporter solute-binding subunit [Dinoroseobacter shibae]URF49771.1 TAXI family TRAP transporter solute-binding subunit [Dinoroseobacter shibae]